MKKAITILTIVLVLFSSCGKPKPKGYYYGGPNENPSIYYYNFSDNTVRVCQGKSTDANCCTEGQWSINDNGDIIISGLSNPNCDFMESLNGTYKLCNTCIPSGKGYKKGDIIIWPDKD
jgi:hypothetical protein